MASSDVTMVIQTQRGVSIEAPLIGSNCLTFPKDCSKIHDLALCSPPHFIASLNLIGHSTSHWQLSCITNEAECGSHCFPLNFSKSRFKISLLLDRVRLSPFQHIFFDISRTKHISYNSLLALILE